ncbi:hypothetical protein FDECE_5276 [Fusarium decemcellulare]|nr:hypothetical protein FDECE_5276 [Fusarium decemcellulare]
MRPVKLTRLEKLITAGTILILDETRLTIYYVNDIVCRCPGNITSKQGNKWLPLELWLEILDWAEFDINSHEHYLVQAQRIEPDGIEPTLVCTDIFDWETCGEIVAGCYAHDYEQYLEQPEEPHTKFQLKNPLVLKDPNGGNAPITRIPLRFLQPGHEILFFQVEVCDIIAWLENGICDLCMNDRTIDTGHTSGMEKREMWSSQVGARWSEYPCTMTCPLCIGKEYSEQSLVQAHPDQYSPDREMHEEDYDEWRDRRFRELGYVL